MDPKALLTRGDHKGKEKAAPRNDDDEATEDDLPSPPPSSEAEEKKRRFRSSSPSSSSLPSTPPVTGRKGGGSGSVGGAAGVYCQAERCTADLTEAKRYHRRHKVCELHSKAPVVMVSGLRQRFCQQCSRFHELSEFDDSKRSCRRRLAGHNERRRKSSSETHGEGSARCRQADPPDSRIPLNVPGNPSPYNKHFQIR